MDTVKPRNGAQDCRRTNIKLKDEVSIIKIMTKKDYELIARSIAESFKDSRDFGGGRVAADAMREIAYHIVSNLASAMAHDNPRFDSARFMKACGV